MRPRELASPPRRCPPLAEVAVLSASRPRAQAVPGTPHGRPRVDTAAPVTHSREPRFAAGLPRAQGDEEAARLVSVTCISGATAACVIGCVSIHRHPVSARIRGERQQNRVDFGIHFIDVHALRAPSIPVIWPSPPPLHAARGSAQRPNLTCTSQRADPMAALSACGPACHPLGRVYLAGNY